MPVILPDNHPLSDFAKKQTSFNKIISFPELKETLGIKIAIVNIMPEAEKYEKYLLKQFFDKQEIIGITFIRLRNHQYKSSNQHHLNNFYTDFEHALRHNKFDGLIITGAPVELVNFENITYYSELRDILNYANQNIKSTMGICWGGILIGHYLGIRNEILSQKLFGVYAAKYTEKAQWIKSQHLSFYCPQSRYAGLDENEISVAEEKAILNTLCKSKEAGSFIFESSDKKLLAHLGHPEYEPSRLIFEYNRDKEKRLNHFPKNFSINKPNKVWEQHASDFFGSWIQLIK